MNHQSLENLDELILEEKRLVAQEHFLNAWEAGLIDGIEADIIAKELITGALRQLTESLGEEETTRMIEQLKLQDLEGEFIANKTVQ
ncbi:MAG: hypothetical protein WBD01_09255 [Salaquimonas sp.]